MQRGLDVLVGLDHADPSRVAVAGCSGGGWQSIFISSLDPRVTLANPVAGYSSFRTRVYHLKDLGDSEQTPCDLATLVDYTHLTAMRAPRPTLLTFNSKDDCCFESGYALRPLLAAAAPIFRLYGQPGALRYHINDVPGTHNFELDNRQAFYKMLGDFFYPGDKQFDPKEIPSDQEIKSPEQLRVPLAENQDFNTLARALAKDLPRDAALPSDPDAAKAWRQARSAELRKLVRARDYSLQAVEMGSRTVWGLAQSSPLPQAGKGSGARAARSETPSQGVKATLRSFSWMAHGPCRPSSWPPAIPSGRQSSWPTPAGRPPRRIYGRFWPAATAC